MVDFLGFVNHDISGDEDGWVNVKCGGYLTHGERIWLRHVILS